MFARPRDRWNQRTVFTVGHMPIFPVLETPQNKKVEAMYNILKPAVLEPVIYSPWSVGGSRRKNSNILEKFNDYYIWWAHRVFFFHVPISIMDKIIRSCTFPAHLYVVHTVFFHEQRVCLTENRAEIK